MNLNTIFTNTANSIRQVGNITEQIKPENFDDKILQLSSSGSASPAYQEAANFLNNFERFQIEDNLLQYDFGYMSHTVKGKINAFLTVEKGIDGNITESVRYDIPYHYDAKEKVIFGFIPKLLIAEKSYSGGGNSFDISITEGYSRNNFIHGRHAGNTSEILSLNGVNYVKKINDNWKIVEDNSDYKTTYCVIPQECFDNITNSSESIGVYEVKSNGEKELIYTIDDNTRNEINYMYGNYYDISIGYVLTYDANIILEAI